MKVSALFNVDKRRKAYLEEKQLAEMMGIEYEHSICENDLDERFSWLDRAEVLLSELGSTIFIEVKDIKADTIIVPIDSIVQCTSINVNECYIQPGESSTIRCMKEGKINKLICDDSFIISKNIVIKEAFLEHNERELHTLWQNYSNVKIHVRKDTIILLKDVSSLKLEDYMDYVVRTKEFSNNVLSKIGFDKRIKVFIGKETIIFRENDNRYETLKQFLDKYKEITLMENKYSKFVIRELKQRYNIDIIADM